MKNFKLLSRVLCKQKEYSMPKLVSGRMFYHVLISEDKPSLVNKEILSPAAHISALSGGK